MKIDKRKRYILILDTETAGGLENPLIYDFGYIIADKHGNIYEERSYLVKEIWEQKNLMTSAYYAEKIPVYEKGIKEGCFKVEKFYNIREELLELLDKYNVKQISAYNLGFDLKALSNTMKNITNKYYYFLPKKYNIKLERVCIWALACQLLFPKSGYINFAIKNNLYTDSGNFLTNAEVAYKYLNSNPEYKEEHTALSDCFIELEILAHCMKQKKKIHNKFMAQPWKYANEKMRF